MLQRQLLPLQAEAWKVHPAQRAGGFPRLPDQLQEKPCSLQRERTISEHGQLAGVAGLGFDGPGLVRASEEVHANADGIVDQYMMSNVVRCLCGIADGLAQHEVDVALVGLIQEVELLALLLTANKVPHKPARTHVKTERPKQLASS